MLNVTNLLTILLYDELEAQQVIPSLYTNAINNDYYPLSTTDNSCFFGKYIETVIITSLTTNNCDYLALFNTMNPGYNIKLQLIWPQYKHSLDLTVEYLQKHLLYYNSTITNIQEECNLYNIKGKIDISCNNHLIEIKATKLLPHKIKKALVQLLIYATIQRLHNIFIEYITLIYPIHELVLTYDIRNWNSHNLAKKLLCLNIVY